MNRKYQKRDARTRGRRIQNRDRDHRNHRVQVSHRQDRAQDHRNHRGRPGQLQASPMIHSMTDSLQTAVRSNHPTAVPYAEKNGCFCNNRFCHCTDIRIFGHLLLCRKSPGVSTYWESPAVTASRNASWQTCLAFPIFGKVRRSTFRAEKVDTGTALLISEWKIEHLYRSIPRISTTGIVRDRISR